MILDYEERDCDADYCVPSCPSYDLLGLKPQREDPTKLEATFKVDEVIFPFGNLLYHGLSLWILDEQLKPRDEKTSNRFRSATFNNIIKVKNVLRDSTFKPVYEFKLEVLKTQSNYIGNPRLKWECDGKVGV